MTQARHRTDKAVAQVVNKIRAIEYFPNCIHFDVQQEAYKVFPPSRGIRK
ncbi:MAG: hypothetical protein BMS9Abin10_0691 [Gammaproteobacteria bacterium]|nr:MAG: hypothetical protein BMS9Abin10_0691 [Gammaproteobacteria bacterium]